jgi:putative flippase GtrA
MVSVVAVACSQTILIFCSAVLDWRPVSSNITAVALSSVPSYLLNRAWVWGRKGQHDWLREVAPFWIFAFIGLGFSTLLVSIASRWSEATAVTSAANLTAFGILWVAKYFILDQVLFNALGGEGDVDEEPALLQ